MNPTDDVRKHIQWLNCFLFVCQRQQVDFSVERPNDDIADPLWVFVVHIPADGSDGDALGAERKKRKEKKE
jgi:hypothetical protein